VRYMARFLAKRMRFVNWREIPLNLEVNGARGSWRRAGCQQSQKSEAISDIHDAMHRRRTGGILRLCGSLAGGHSLALEHEARGRQPAVAIRLDDRLDLGHALEQALFGLQGGKPHAGRAERFLPVALRACRGSPPAMRPAGMARIVIVNAQGHTHFIIDS